MILASCSTYVPFIPWVSRTENYEIGYLFGGYLLLTTIAAHPESHIPLYTEMMHEVIYDSSDAVCDTSSDTQV